MTYHEKARGVARRCSPARFLLALLLALLLHAPSALATAPDPPNVVILFADDLGYGELWTDDADRIPTPALDAFAAQGVRFTDGYVTSSFCSPSRAGLMTGRYQTRFGYEYNPTKAANADPRVGLPASEVTLAELLRDAGYTTGLVGKWHLGGSAGAHPQRHGFDEFFGFLHEGHYYVPPPYEGVTTWLRRRALPGGAEGRWTSGDGRLVYSTHLGRNEPPYDADNPILRGGQPVQEEAYLTDAITRESVDFIERHRDKPFFLYVAYNAVHSPMQGADAYMERFAHIEDVQRRIFAAMLANLDASVGAIMQKLRAEGLDDNTLVFFISDNGGPTRELTSRNDPLRGGKGDLYEGGIRVPFMARWPGRLPAGVVERRPVLSLDVFATAAAAGAALPQDRRIDGIDLMPFLTGEAEGRPHDVLYWRMGNRTAVRVGDWKLVQNDRRGVPLDRWELYDLSGDAAERHDLAAERPETFRELHAVWSRLDAEMSEPSWHPGMLRRD